MHKPTGSARAKTFAHSLSASKLGSQRRRISWWSAAIAALVAGASAVVFTGQV